MSQVSENNSSDTLISIDEVIDKILSLKGEILTLIETAVHDPERVKSAKDMARGSFSRTLKDIERVR